jgi:fibronectin type 3 domain-containing protein
MGAAASSQTRTVRAKGQVHHRIHLHWNAPAQSSEAMAGYNIYRSSDGGKSFKKVNTSPVAKPEYDDTAVRRGLTYIYVVKSVDNNGAESGPSNKIRMRMP